MLSEGSKSVTRAESYAEKCGHPTDSVAKNREDMAELLIHERLFLNPFTFDSYCSRKGLEEKRAEETVKQNGATHVTTPAAVIVNNKALQTEQKNEELVTV